MKKIPRERKKGHLHGNHRSKQKLVNTHFLQKLRRGNLFLDYLICVVYKVLEYVISQRKFSHFKDDCEIYNGVENANCSSNSKARDIILSFPELMLGKLKINK